MWFCCADAAHGAHAIGSHQHLIRLDEDFLAAKYETDGGRLLGYGLSLDHRVRLGLVDHIGVLGVDLGLVHLDDLRVGDVFGKR